MKVVFRVDASLMIGSGHVMRCLVLADELKLKGHDIAFACMPLEGDMRSFISERGFRVITLTAPQVAIISTHDADYESWLQKDVDVDAQDFLRSVSSADLVITDHYAIGEQWQKRVKSALGCYLFAIDDLARRHHADLILDQTLGRQPEDYSDSATHVLAGSQFALLSPSFFKQRQAALLRQFPNDLPKILISMGGIDAPNATLSVLKALCDKVSANFTVLLSPRAPHFQAVKQWCASRPHVEHKEFVTDMASLMLSHDIAIGAPGTTSWERACLGLPNIIIPIAENQRMICQQLAIHGASLSLEINQIPHSLYNAYQKIVEHWASFKAANLTLCDGLGTRRVGLEIDYLLNNGSDGVFLSRASLDDIERIYTWQCHPETRRYALNPHIPTWEEHKAWMTNKLQSACDYYYMVIDRINNHKVGVVRLDRMDQGEYLVSIFIDPQHYGKGIARKALAALDSLHSNVTLHATVLKENLASQNLFQKAGYQKINQDAYLRKPID
jgi:UDP-2,4-diacetamido-2,4,6-trideoxy-beta-L-altropyranose hydrolase